MKNKTETDLEVNAILNNENYDLAIAKLLFEKKDKEDLDQYDMRSALSSAFSEKGTNTELVKFLVEKGITLFSSHLKYACRSNDIEIVRLFLSKNVEIDFETMQEVREQNNTELLKLLIEALLNKSSV